MNMQDHIFVEHHQYYYNQVVHESISKNYTIPIYFKSKIRDDYCCFSITNEQAYTSYFIGIDWLNEQRNKAIYIQPKLNKGTEQLDYVKMLFTLMKHPETLGHIDDIYEIKWDDTPIEISSNQDHLTPILIVQFLHVLKSIVRKGLKKSYYKVENNLFGKVKGKILVAKTIKENTLKNKPLNTKCQYDKFGINGIENRLLKKTLVFVSRYLNSFKIDTQADLSNLFNYINPAFIDVSEEVSLNEFKHSKKNSFYKEYEEGIKLSKLILKRFGYNINNTQSKVTFKTPPFWIDMSKLFELYVLGELKEVFGPNLYFQYGYNKGETYYGMPDFIVKKEGFSLIMDAKYKRQYQPQEITLNDYIIKDIRQLSGYARDNRIIKFLNDGKNEIIECCIIYPDERFLGEKEEFKIDIESKLEIYQFNKFFKLPVKLPVQKKNNLSDNN